MTSTNRQNSRGLRTPTLVLLIIIIIPLLGQLGFICWLSMQLLHRQTEITRASHAGRLASETFQLMWDSLQTLYVANLTGNLSDLFDVATMQTTSAKLTKRLDVLFRLTEGEPSQRRQVQVIRGALQTLKSGTALTGRRAGARDPRTPAAIRNPYDTLYSETKKYTTAVDNLLAFEASKIARNAEDSRQLHATVGFALSVAIPLCFLQLVVLGLLYETGIRRPLKRISENSRRMSLRAQLLPASTGVDEISKLDRLFHSVAHSVNEALSKEESVLRNAGDLICSLDEESFFIRVNPYASKLFGLESNEIVDKYMLDFVLPDDRANVGEKLQAARSSFEAVAFEVRMRRADGTEFDTRWSLFWSAPENCFFCVAHDITEEKNIERLKQNFLDLISKDLRNPLRSIADSMSLIQSGVKGPISAVLERDAKNNKHSIERLILLIDDLLDFQKISSGQLQLVTEKAALSEVVSAAVEMVENVAAAKGISIDVSGDALIVIADKRKLMQVLLNLLSNAIKFSPKNGRIIISSIRHIDAVEVTVTDCGPGVPDGFNQKIFEAFGQAPSEKAKEGTGLGLSICKMIIEAHGGTMGVRKAEATATGSSFWFRIPCDV